ncbi:MAG: hypothetical protein HC837_16600 [Chloroflexaceae bacterium]|nr:hypothetical protein [Chloroflexaceae bacterium]
MSETIVTFPPLEARNLEGRGFRLPQDFGGEQNLAMVAFQRWHQGLIDSWMPYLTSLQQTYDRFQVYELPTLSFMYTLMRPIIDGGMSAAIPNKATREHTLTMYTDVNRVVRSLGLSDTSTIGLFLVERGGRIIWHGQGGYDEHQAAALKQALDRSQML